MGAKLIKEAWSSIMVREGKKGTIRLPLAGAPSGLAAGIGCTCFFRHGQVSDTVRAGAMGLFN